MSKNLSSRRFSDTGGHFDRKFHPAERCCCHTNTRVIFFHVVLKCRQYVISFRHKARVACDRQTHGRTDRITAAKTALALLRRAVNKNRSTGHSWNPGLVDPGTSGTTPIIRVSYPKVADLPLVLLHPYCKNRLFIYP